jgi:hypothetical protein
MNYRIIPAFRESFRRPNAMVRSGWHLIVDDEWVQWFATKREAMAVLRAIREERDEQRS